MKLTPLSKLIGSFAEGLLEDAGLHAIALRVASGEALPFDDLEQIHQLPLPLLGLMSEIRRSCTPGKSPPYLPTIVLPLGRTQEQLGLQAAIEESLTILQEYANPIDDFVITFDQWDVHSSFEDFLNSLSILLRSIDADNFSYLGPSLDTLLPTTAVSLIELKRIERYLDKLALLGFTLLRSSLHSPLIEVSIEKGFSIQLEQKLETTEGSPLRLDSLEAIQSLQSLLQTVTLSSRIATWKPTLETALSDFASHAPLRFDILRTASLLGLLLPQETMMVLPPRLLGSSLLSLSSRFGADSLGHLCVNHAALTPESIASVEMTSSTDPGVRAFTQGGESTAETIRRVEVNEH